VFMRSFTVRYRTEDFLDRMAINPPTLTAVDYAVCIDLSEMCRVNAL